MSPPQKKVEERELSAALAFIFHISIDQQQTERHHARNIKHSAGLFLFTSRPGSLLRKTETAKSLLHSSSSLIVSLLPQHSLTAASVRPKTRGFSTSPSATSCRRHRVTSTSGRRVGPRRSCGLLSRPCRHPPAALNSRRAALTPLCRWRSRGERSCTREKLRIDCSQSRNAVIALFFLFFSDGVD